MAHSERMPSSVAQNTDLMTRWTWCEYLSAISYVLAMQAALGLVGSRRRVRSRQFKTSRLIFGKDPLWLFLCHTADLPL